MPEWTKILQFLFDKNPKNLCTFRKSVFKNVLKNMKKIFFSASGHKADLHLSNVNLDLTLIHDEP